MFNRAIIFLCTLVAITSSVPAFCTQKQPKKLLVTGCGRSGTTYMNVFLRASGWDVNHEWMGGDGSVSWLLGAETDKAPWGPLARDFEFEHIFHQVREPLKVIQSFYNSPPLATWLWISHCIPQVKMSDTKLTKCAKYWIHWNKMVEAKAEWRYRIEDFDVQYKEMGRRLGVEFDPAILAGVSKKTNTRGPPARTITWGILRKELDPPVYRQVRNLAKRYGYEVPAK